MYGCKSQEGVHKDSKPSRSWIFVKSPAAAASTLATYSRNAFVSLSPSSRALSVFLMRAPTSNWVKNYEGITLIMRTKSSLNSGWDLGVSTFRRLARRPETRTNVDAHPPMIAGPAPFNALVRLMSICEQTCATQHNFSMCTSLHMTGFQSWWLLWCFTGLPHKPNWSLQVCWSGVKEFEPLHVPKKDGGASS